MMTFCFIMESNKQPLTLLQFLKEKGEEEKEVEEKEEKEQIYFLLLVTMKRDAGPEIQFQNRTMPENYR